jgi:hypothetical protein
MAFLFNDFSCSVRPGFCQRQEVIGFGECFNRKLPARTVGDNLWAVLAPGNDVGATDGALEIDCAHDSLSLHMAIAARAM